MRLALALAAVVVSARQDYLCAEDVCFYHVPKTGGDSFKNLLRDKLKRRGRTFWSNEWCPRRSNGTAAMLFREPRAHVVSQYFECREGGDSPYRKGFYDAMLAGCIPVIFSLQNELVAPWFVPKGVAVRLSERAYGNGTFRALDVLRRIPSAEIRRRQSIIRKHGHRLQYAVDDRGTEPDAVETLFVGALGLAHDLAALYL